MREFKVNELISLKLEDGNTIIQVNGKEFVQCKGVVLNRTLDELKHISFDWSIDELADHAEHEGTWDLVSPETEFLVHCSNLSAWAENNYNSELLHGNLAFPLLKKLVEEGDETAKRVFKEEIIKRLESGYLPVITYLSEEEYDEYLTREEWYNAILGHDRQGFREADALIDFEEMMGRKLDLVESMDTEVGYDFRIENRRVVGISIGGCELKSIPESIGNLINLKEIHIFDRGIDRIPESIGNLENLEILDIPSNKLEILSDSLTNLENLNKLDLRGNLLKELPKDIGELSNLECLDLSHNNLDTLPDSINQLRDLKFLYLNHNNLTDISCKLENLYKLEVLNVKFNNIVDLEPQIKTLVNLKKLYINNNKIRDLSPLIDLPKLEELRIYNNNLSCIPEKIENMRNLRILDLSENAIKELPKSIINMGSSLTINLRGNPEFTISDIFLHELKEKNIEIYFLD